MKKRGKNKENRRKWLKNMRADREGYGSNYHSVNASQLPEKAICCVPVSFIASSCKTPTTPYSTTVYGKITIEEKRRKRNCVNRFWRPISTSRSVWQEVLPVFSGDGVEENRRRWEIERRDGKNPLVLDEYGVPLIGQRNKKRTPNRSWLEVQDTMKIKDWTEIV